MAKIEDRRDEVSDSETQCEAIDHPESFINSTVLKSDIDSLGIWETVKKFKYAILVCNILCITALADGYQYNLSGSIIANKGFINHVGSPDKNGVKAIKSNHIVIWGAFQSLGEMFGMISLTPISDHYGRKTTMMVIWVILVGALILETVFRNWKDWAGAKVFAAIGIGGIQAALPVYVTELSPVNIRGGMIFIYAFWYTVGKVFANMVLMVVQEVSPDNYKIPILTQWGLLGIMLPVCLWIPESPAFFAEHDRDEEGKQVLLRVNGMIKGYDVEKEYEILKHTIVHEKKVSEKPAQKQQSKMKQILKPYAECFNRTNIRRTVGASLPACAQQLSGLAFLNTYASVFFKQCGFENAFLVVTVMCVIQFVAVVILIFVTDKFGRRNMVCISLVVCTAALLFIGVLAFVDKSQAIKNLLMVIACVWSFASAVIGTVGYAFVGEVASQKLRAVTAGVASSLSLIFGLIFYTTTPILLDVDGANWGYKTAWLFFGVSTIACVLLFLFLPECSQRNAAEMDEMFEKGIMAWNMHKYTTDVQKQQMQRAAQCGSPQRS